MKKILFLLTLAICSISSAQVDTTVTISSFQGYTRKAQPVEYSWNSQKQVMQMTVLITPYASNGDTVNNPMIRPYSRTISTEGTCVVASTGAEVPCTTDGCIPQYTFLFYLSKTNLSLWSQKVMYIQIADSNGAFN
jgi:hypothetical protein